MKKFKRLSNISQIRLGDLVRTEDNVKNIFKILEITEITHNKHIEVKIQNIDVVGGRIINSTIGNINFPTLLFYSKSNIGKIINYKFLNDK